MLKRYLSNEDTRHEAGRCCLETIRSRLIAEDGSLSFLYTNAHPVGLESFGLYDFDLPSESLRDGEPDRLFLFSDDFAALVFGYLLVGFLNGCHFLREYLQPIKIKFSLVGSSFMNFSDDLLKYFCRNQAS